MNMQSPFPPTVGKNRTSRGVLPYMDYTGMYNLKVYGLLATLVINRESILSNLVSKRVWFLPLVLNFVCLLGEAVFFYHYQFNKFMAVFQASVFIMVCKFLAPCINLFLYLL